MLDQVLTSNLISIIFRIRIELITTCIVVQYEQAHCLGIKSIDGSKGQQIGSLIQIKRFTRHEIWGLNQTTVVSNLSEEETIHDPVSRPPDTWGQNNHSRGDYNERQRTSMR